MNAQFRVKQIVTHTASGRRVKIVALPTEGFAADMVIFRTILSTGRLGKMYHRGWPSELSPITNQQNENKIQA